MSWRYYVGPRQGSILRILPDCYADQRRELNMLFLLSPDPVLAIVEAVPRAEVAGNAVVPL